MFGVSRDLTRAAYETTRRHVPWHPMRRPYYTPAAFDAVMRRMGFRYRLERLRLFAALRRGEIDFME